MPFCAWRTVKCWNFRIFYMMSDSPNQPTLLILKNIGEFAAVSMANSGYPKALSAYQPNCLIGSSETPMHRFCLFPHLSEGLKLGKGFLG